MGCHDFRFEAYKNATKVGKFRELGGKKLDLANDAVRGYIRIVDVPCCEKCGHNPYSEGAGPSEEYDSDEYDSD